MKCYTIGGNMIAEILLDRDATVGQFKNKLLGELIKKKREGEALETRMSWFDLRVFQIGERTYAFDDDYFRFMLTEPVKTMCKCQRLTNQNPAPELTCTIIQFPDAASHIDALTRNR